MISVTIPTTDVNSESATVLRWYVADRSAVREGEELVEVETSKAILDVVAPAAGVVLRACRDGEQVRLDQSLAYVFDSSDDLEQFASAQAQAQAGAQAEAGHGSEAAAGRITAPARRRATELGVDIDEVARGVDELVTRKHVEAFAAAHAPEIAPSDLPDPLEARPGAVRLLLIGAGMSALQILDILAPDEQRQAIAVVDDDRTRHGAEVGGLPVVGATERGLELFAAGAFDAAVICVGTSIPARRRLRLACQAAGLPLVNAIDPSSRLLSDVRIGAGNVICANCHFGVGTVIGDNNFISAYNSFDHHSVLGSDIATGPGCFASGRVTIEDRVRLGTGIFIQPYVTLGAGAQVASGAVITASVPAEHAVKTRVVTTTVVPIRELD